MASIVRILLVEDSALDAELIEKALIRGNGYRYEIKRVATMKEVVSSVNKYIWDVIICDYSLPGFDGADVLQLLDELDIDTPFILISGVASEELVDKAMAMGVSEYVSKNNLPKLIQVIRRELRITLTYDETLKAFVRALSFRDDETSGHSERVVSLTKRLARRVGLFEPAILHIARGALLHDIGKLGVMDSILLKKGPLTTEEFELMKMHPIIGRDLLSGIPFLKKAGEVPHYHHERWDGSGYPYGLEGNDIPMSARIFAVVDVFDAMTSNRPYREALSEDFVLTYLSEQSGRLFDPRVVDAFIAMMEKK